MKTPLWIPVCSALLVASAVGLAVAGERLLSAPTPAQPANPESAAVSPIRQQTEPAVAMLGKTALVVWEDTRRSGPLRRLETDLYAALVDLAAGTANVTKRFTLATGLGEQATPTVAASANEFVVVWSDVTEAGTDLKGAVIPPAGPMGRPAIFTVAASPLAEVTPAIAYSPVEGKYLVVYNGDNGSGAVKAARIDPNSSPPTVSSPSTVSASAGTQHIDPRVAWAGSQWVVAWNDILPSTPSPIRGIYFARLAANSTSAGASTQVAAGITSDKSAPEVVGSPGKHLIVWSDNRAAPGPGLYGVQVDGAGVVTPTDGRPLRTGVDSISRTRGAFMPAGLTAYVLLMDEFVSGNWRLTSAWYSPNATLDPFGTGGSIDTFAPGSHRGLGIGVNTDFKGLAVYSDDSDVLLVPVTSIGKVDGTLTRPVTALPAQEEGRVAAANANLAVVAWPQWNGVDGGTDLAFRRYDFAGNPLDPSPLPLNVGPTQPVALQLAASPTEAFALFSSVEDGGLRTDVHAARIPLTGAADPAFAVSSNTATETASSLTFDGTHYLALWQLHILSGGSPPRSLVGRRFAPNGTMVDANPFLVHARAAALDFIRGTATATPGDGGSTLVVVDYQSGIEALYRTLVQNGAASDTAGGLLIADGGFPTAASSGTAFFVAWEDHRLATRPDLFGQRLDATGAPIDAEPVPLEVGPSDAEKPNLTFNGKHYLLTWHERLTDGGYAVKGRWLTTSLATVDELAVPRTADELLPRAASNGAGRSLLATARLAETDEASVPRLYTQSVSAGLMGDKCSSNAHCFSGACVDGVCCNTACQGGCNACSKARGASADGVCTVRAAGAECRPAATSCDAPELCDGTSSQCPDDAVAAKGTVCRPPVGGCDYAEQCTGQSDQCPADLLLPAGALCAAASEETCEAEARCTGTQAQCAPIPVKEDGASCAKGGGKCTAGVCEKLERSRYAWGCSAAGAGGSADGASIEGAWLAGLSLVILALLRRQRRREGLGLVAALAVAGIWLWPSPGIAATPARLKLVFTGVSAGAGIPEATARSISEHVQSELARLDRYDVVSQSDLQTLLGMERQKQLLGCSGDSSCLAELAGALDADRLLRGELARLDNTVVLNLSLLDLRRSTSLSRVGRAIDRGGLDEALAQVRPMLFELLNQAPEQKAAPLVAERDFGGLAVGLRADGDVLAGGLAPAVSAELSGRTWGGAVTVIGTLTPGVRFEARAYPLTLERVRPYLCAGSTIFTTGLGLRAGAGAAVKTGPLLLAVDAAYERYVLEFRPGYASNALLLGVAALWQI